MSEEKIEEEKRVYADLKFVEETPIEEVNRLVHANKLTFIGNKASQLWKDKNKEKLENNDK